MSSCSDVVRIGMEIEWRGLVDLNSETCSDRRYWVSIPDADSIVRWALIRKQSYTLSLLKLSLFQYRH